MASSKIELTRVSAYAGKNCCPLKIRGLDPEKDMEDAIEAVERLFKRPWTVEVVDSIDDNGILLITEAKVRMEKDLYGN